MFAHAHMRCHSCTLMFMFCVRAQANSLAGTCDHAHASKIEGCTTSMAFRPPPKRANNGDEGGSQPKRGRTGNGEPRDPIQNRSELSNRAYDKLVELSVGVRECKEELKIVRDNQRGLGIQLKKMEENQKKIVSLINSLKKATFAIKGSEYEVS